MPVSRASRRCFVHSKSEYGRGARDTGSLSFLSDRAEHGVFRDLVALLAQVDLVPFPVFPVQRFVGGAGFAELGGGVGEGGVFFGGDFLGGVFEVGVRFPSCVGGGGGHEED